MQTPNTTRTQPEQKKPYTEPQLIEHGTVKDLTEKTGSTTDQAAGGSFETPLEGG